MTSSTEKTADLLAAVLANLARVVGSITPEQLHDRPAGTCPARLRKGGRGRASEGQRSLGRLVVALLSSRPTCSEHGGDPVVPAAVDALGGLVPVDRQMELADRPAPAGAGRPHIRDRPLGEARVVG